MMKPKPIEEAANAQGLAYLGCIPSRAGEFPAFAERIGASRDLFEQWIGAGKHAGMSWIVRNGPLRHDASLVFEACTQVLVFAMPFSKAADRPPEPAEPRGIIASYAAGIDYHKIFRNKLRLVWKSLSKDDPVPQSRILIDANPLSERLFAVLGGRGFIGKNTMFIIPDLGSRFFLGTILTTGAPINGADEAKEDGAPHGPMACPADCKRCFNACPTGALTLTVSGQGSLDSRKCLSWQSIESGQGIAISERSANGNRVFGCESCLDACPFNKDPKHTRRVSLEHMLTLDSQAAFLDEFASTALVRAGWKQTLANTIVAAGNAGNPDLLERLRALSINGDPLIRDHALWAIDRIIAPDS